jgi:acetyl-CoA/propionyl-CoA carboxylase biotin carboxyl carrier protein
VTALALPTGPGVRVDTGITAGDVIGGNFDSLLAKLIVTGETRAEALQRARRALDEMVVQGLATVLPFHRLVVRDPSFVDEPFRVHTRWIETEWENTVVPFSAPAQAAPVPERTTIVVEVAGKRLEVSLPADVRTGANPGAGTRSGGARRSRAGHAPAVAGNALVSPMQGTIVKVAAAEGDTVAEGDLIVVLEAMKMEQPLNAHRSGIVTNLTADVGATIASGAAICEIA